MFLFTIGVFLFTQNTKRSQNRNLDPEYIKQRVNAISKIIKVEDILNKKAKGLTADAQQKISLGRGMVREDVNAILFDEPLTVIDPHMKWELRTQLKALHKEFKHTMIFVTHDQTEALTFADKVVVMNEGTVVQIGTPEELFEKPAHTFVGYFIGSPGMNLFDIEINGNIANLQGNKIKLKTTYKNLEGKIQLGIRPEFINLCEDKNGIEINIIRIEDVGHYKIVRAKYNNKDINIIVSEDAQISPSMNKMTFNLEKVNIYINDWLVKGELL